jgi:hypothetical protein
MVVSTKSEYMDKANQAISSGTWFSTNMMRLSISKKENSIAQILATKFHTNPVMEP